MTRRDLVHKWLIYTLGLLPVWVLDACILPRFPLFGTVAPMLLPLAVSSVAVLEGACAGTGFGMAVGLLWELAYPGGFGGLVFYLALAGMAFPACSRWRSRSSCGPWCGPPWFGCCSGPSMTGWAEQSWHKKENLWIPNSFTGGCGRWCCCWP